MRASGTYCALLLGVYHADLFLGLLWAFLYAVDVVRQRQTCFQDLLNSFGFRNCKLYCNMVIAAVFVISIVLSLSAYNLKNLLTLC